MRLRIAALLFVLLGGARAHAQACTSCSPLALPSSVAGGLDSSARGRDWFLLGQITGGWLSFPGQTARGVEYQDPNQPRIDLGLLALQVRAQHRSGLGFEVLMPAALLQASDLFATRRDPGLGDLETRGRYTHQFFTSLSAAVSAGVALPTGRYAPRSGALALSASASALTPGRGARWGLVEGESRWSPWERLATSLSLGTRLPLTDAPDGFRWAPEVRSVLEAQVQLWPGKLAAGAGLEAQWRGVSSVIDPFLEQRVDSTNTGGFSLTALPSLTAQLPGGFFTSLSVRVPLYQRLAGLQFVQGLGVFASIGFSFAAGNDRAVHERDAARGGWAVLQYEADWCVACKKLSSMFADARARTPALKFITVDVTAWSQEELEAAAPGAQALPLIEIRRPDGSLAARLEGQDAFAFERRIEELNP